MGASSDDGQGQDSQAVKGTSRRQFLVWSGTALGGAAVASAFGTPGENPEALEVLTEQMEPVADIFGWPVIMRRSRDQLLLTLRGYNVSIDYTQSPPVLTRVSDVLPSYLTVEFGTEGAPAPMHVTERAYPLSDSDLPSQTKAPIKKPTSTSAVGAPPVGSRISGGTTLAFALPPSVLAPVADEPLTLSTADMLNWVGLLLEVVPNAVPPITTLPTGVGPPRAPNLAETAIELPYNLVISPPVRPTAGITESSTVFVNAIDPVTHNGWTELWHTRMAARVRKTFGDFSILAVDETNRDLRTVRAIWCTDPTFATDLAAQKSDDQIPDNGHPPFTSALRYVDRYDIVRLSGDFTPDSAGGPYLRGRLAAGNIVIKTGYLPAPATVDRLMLTSLGAWFDGEAHWDLEHSTKANHFNSSLLAWRQRTVQARDSYVRVVRKGYLFPWGHRASLVTVTEREFTEIGGRVGAYLRQKTFIVVTQPTKNYSASDSIKSGGRNVPFTDVEALTIVTPDLKAPAKYVTATKNGAAVQTSAELLFQPKNLDGSVFKFHFRGTDWAGDPIDMRTPVLWVDDTVAYADNASRKTLMDEAFKKWKAAYPVIKLDEQRVSMAAPKDPAAAAGDTQVVLVSYELGVAAPKSSVTAEHLVETSQPAFFPALQSAAVKMPEAGTISGATIGTTTMVYESDYYLADGFTGNPGGVFLKRQSGSVRQAVKFRTDKSGGSFTPNVGVDGLSREIGPLSGNIANLAQGTFDPADVFDGLDAKLLGGVELQTILQTVGFGDGNNAQALQITSVERIDPHRIETIVDWHPTIQTGGPTVGGQQIDVFVPVGDLASSMDLIATLVTDLEHPANSTSTVVGQIRDFELHLFGSSGSEYFINIPFDSLSFRSESGKKTDVDVAIGAAGVQFQGALSFVQDLADFLSFAGSGLTIDTSGDAIRADLTLALPSISVGVFGLENIAFSAGVAIPYNGDPVRFDFAFSSRDNPFQLSIMVFTGGGFVGLGIGADGVEMLEFSFDFGLGISIDIGIASGEVSLTGGVYYECEKQDDGGQSIELTAWVKAYGGISALGVVSISVELYLALTYQSDGSSSQLAGDATMTISVHVLFFGGDVHVSVHEEFAGSGDSLAANGAQGAPRALASTLADTAPVNSFGATMTAQDWAQYCTSFALIGVGV